jgi:3-hydroxyisobutyrate dehydrogenase-like beta-hydroxyacid dehydrogenase
VVPADKPWKTLDELLMYGKKNPGKLIFTTSGNWGATMTPGARILIQAGVEATYIPYKRGGPAMQALLEVLKGSAAYSKAMDMKGDRMVKRELEPASGKLAFHLKDVRLMLDLGRRLNFPLMLTSLHAQALTSLVAKGMGEWDNAAIISFYDDQTA